MTGVPRVSAERTSRADARLQSGRVSLQNTHWNDPLAISARASDSVGHRTGWNPHLRTTSATLSLEVASQETIKIEMPGTLRAP
jgi:hypothetical protein